MLPNVLLNILFIITTFNKTKIENIFSKMVDLSEAGNNTSVDGRVKYSNKDYRTQGPLLKTDLLKYPQLIDKPSCSSYKESISKRCNFAASDMNTQDEL